MTTDRRDPAPASPTAGGAAPAAPLDGRAAPAAAGAGTLAARNYLPSLTGLRAVLAFVVFGGHFTALGLTAPHGTEARSFLQRALEVLFSYPSVAVSGFFVLSGFVLTWIAKPADRARDFYRRRVAKIYPVHLVTTVAALVAVVAAFGWPAWTILASHALMLHAWIPSQFAYFGLNVVSWSLSCEAFFYLCFPLLLALLPRIRARGLYAVLGVCLLSIFGLPALVGGTFALARPDSFEMVPTAGGGGPFVFWFAYLFPPARLPEFVLGVVIALLLKRGSWRGPNVAVSLLLCVAGWALNYNLPGYLHFQAGMVIPWMFLIAALVRADLEGRWSPLRSRTMVWLGEVSFSFYACHLLAQEQLSIRIGIWMYGRGWVPDNTVTWQWYQALPFMLLELAVALLVAWLLHRVVELPLQRLLRPRPRTPSAPATAAEVPAGTG
ncbi:acyltransferase [Actinomadura sp. ATCC 31491]|uniref:Acyltransferase n=1 Tax=Actinomadura luzonensis TaxID=2805427 RepID=A0ABT0G944_9ACTN|nr:acyltransferase [Actinomadura luzonensis]MCK2221111.1 acyltransferase [Actinomadura luzonensis]